MSCNFIHEAAPICSVVQENNKKVEINPVSSSSTGKGSLKHSKLKNKGKTKGKWDCWAFHQFLEVAGRTCPSVGSSLVLSEVSAVLMCTGVYLGISW